VGQGPLSDLRLDGAVHHGTAIRKQRGDGANALAFLAVQPDRRDPLMGAQRVLAPPRCFASAIPALIGVSRPKSTSVNFAPSDYL